MAALEEILQRHPVWRGQPARSAVAAVPTGYPALDAALPGGGWPRGALTEILGNAQGIGELQLVVPALAALTWAGKRVAWLAPPHLPYAPALAAAGVDLAHLVVVHAPGRRDALWAAEQVLRAGCCHALLGWFRRAGFDELRRLAVAAAASPAWVALYRPREAAAEPSPAVLRLALEVDGKAVDGKAVDGKAADGDALAVRILKRRGTPAAAPLRLTVKRPLHALGRTSFSGSAARHARTDRRLGLPVHA